MATRSSILPKSVQIVVEDRPLLRIRETDEDSTDYELNPNQLLALSKQGLEAYMHAVSLGLYK